METISEDFWEHLRHVPSKTNIGLVETVTPRKISITIFREQYLLVDTLNREENQTTHTDLRKKPDLLRAATESLSVSRWAHACAFTRPWGMHVHTTACRITASLLLLQHPY